MPRAPSLEVAIVDAGLCDACGLCMPLCPPGAIHMRRHGLLIDEAACTGCRKCVSPCPVGALAMRPRESEMGNREAVAAPRFPVSGSRFPIP